MTEPSSSSASLVKLSRWEKVTRYWVLHIWSDYLWSLPIGAWLLAEHCTNHKLMLISLPPESRRPLWTALLGTSGTVVALMLTSVSILINLIRTPLSDLDKLFAVGQKRQIGQTILKGMPSLGGLFVVALIAAVTDSRTKVGNWPVEAVVALMLAASVSHVSRVVWIIRKLLMVSG